MTVKELALYFNVTNKCMRSKIERLGLNLKCLNRNKYYEWTSESIDFLKNNYLNMTYSDIAKVLGNGCTEAMIMRKIKALNLESKNYFMSHTIKCPKDGYAYYNCGTKRVFIYRENMEKLLGRPLATDEIVHHIDCDKTNDDIDNLLLCSSSEHKKLHCQLECLARDLIKSGVIKFNKDNRMYEIVMPTRTEGYPKDSQGQRIESEKI